MFPVSSACICVSVSLSHTHNHTHTLTHRFCWNLKVPGEVPKKHRISSLCLCPSVCLSLFFVCLLTFPSVQMHLFQYSCTQLYDHLGCLIPHSLNLTVICLSVCNLHLHIGLRVIGIPFNSSWYIFAVHTFRHSLKMSSVVHWLCLLIPPACCSQKQNSAAYEIRNAKEKAWAIQEYNKYNSPHNLCQKISPAICWSSALN